MQNFLVLGWENPIAGTLNGANRYQQICSMGRGTKRPILPVKPAQKRQRTKTSSDPDSSVLDHLSADPAFLLVRSTSRTRKVLHGFAVFPDVSISSLAPRQCSSSLWQDTSIKISLQNAEAEQCSHSLDQAQQLQRWIKQMHADNAWGALGDVTILRGSAASQGSIQ